MDQIIDSLVLYTVESGLVTWYVLFDVYISHVLMMSLGQHHHYCLASLREYH